MAGTIRQQSLSLQHRTAMADGDSHGTMVAIRRDNEWNEHGSITDTDRSSGKTSNQPQKHCHGKESESCYIFVQHIIPML